MTRVLVAIACALLLLNRYGVPSEVLGEFLVAAIHVLRPGAPGLTIARALQKLTNWPARGVTCSVDLRGST